MKLFKALTLALCLFLTPALSLAGDDGFDDFGDDVADDFAAAVPEPAGSLVMAAGLLTVGMVWRHRRRR